MRKYLTVNSFCCYQFFVKSSILDVEIGSEYASVSCPIFHRLLKVNNQNLRPMKEAATGGVLSEKLLLDISQNSQEND